MRDIRCQLVSGNDGDSRHTKATVVEVPRSILSQHSSAIIPTYLHASNAVHMHGNRSMRLAPLLAVSSCSFAALALLCLLRKPNRRQPGIGEGRPQGVAKPPIVCVDFFEAVTDLFFHAKTVSR